MNIDKYGDWRSFFPIHRGTPVSVINAMLAGTPNKTWGFYWLHQNQQDTAWKP